MSSATEALRRGWTAFSAGKAVRLNGVSRMIAVGLHLACGLLTAAVLFPFMSHARKRARIRSWSGRLLAILGVRLDLHGVVSGARGCVMLVANHVSWLDVFVINAVRPVRFIAKSEVRAWPAIGWLAARTGTLFVRRAHRSDVLRVNGDVEGALAAGDIVAVFPEGTTTDGLTVLPFHGSLLEPGIRAGAAFVPVALRFERDDGTLCAAAAYLGDQALWASLLAVSREPAITARVHFLEPVASGAMHRRDLARITRESILRTLSRPVPGSRTARSDGLPAAAR